MNIFMSKVNIHKKVNLTVIEITLVNVLDIELEVKDVIMSHT